MIHDTSDVFFQMHHLLAGLVIRRGDGLARPEDARTHRADRAAEETGRLLVSEPKDLCEEERVPLLGLEADAHQPDARAVDEPAPAPTVHAAGDGAALVGRRRAIRSG